MVRRRQKNPAKERSSTELRFALFRFLLCLRGETCQGSPMNALRAPLTALAARREQSCLFLLDNADVVIEGMLRQLTTDPMQQIQRANLSREKASCSLVSLQKHAAFRTGDSDRFSKQVEGDILKA